MANSYEDTTLRKVYDDLSGNLKLLYDFSDGGSSVSVTDKSDNSLTGTIVSGATGDNVSAANMWTNGGGGGLNLDGTNDYVDIDGTDIFSGHAVGSIEMWIDIEELDKTQMLFNYAKTTDTSNRHNIHIAADNTIRSDIVSATTDAINTDNSITATGIYHLVMTNDGVAWKLYLNSVSQAFTWTTGSVTIDWFDDLTGSDTITLGSYLTGGNTTDYYFNGTFYKFAVYDIALTQTQITKIFRNERLLFDQDVRPDVPIRNPGRSETNMTTGLIFQDI